MTDDAPAWLRSAAAAGILTPAINTQRAAEEMAVLAHNLGVSDATFQAILDEARARAQASAPDWGRPHEVAAEIRRRLLEVATTP